MQNKEKTENNNVMIRKGRSEDISVLFALVKELAVFEKAAEEVITTEELYHRLFDEKLFDFFVAEENNTVHGIALFYLTFSTWKGKMMYLEDFVVYTEQRGSGVGRLFFEEVLGEVRDMESMR